MHRTLVALLVVLAAGPALAGGTVATDTGAQVSEESIETAGPPIAASEHLDCSYPLDVTDGTGETVTIEEEPDEIVLLGANVAQHVWELGAEEKVIGMPVNQFTSYLEGSEERTNVVGDFGRPVNEEVISLEADLVLAPNIISEDTVSTLRQNGQTVYYYPLATDLDTVVDLVGQTGELVGACDSAESVTSNMSEQIDLVENAVSDVDKPSAFYDLGNDPGGPYTVSEGSLEHDVITTAGTENIAADVGESAYPEVQPEFILNENPEVIISPESLSDFAGYNETSAMQDDRVITVNGNFISQHGPRNVDVLVALATELHPDAMEDARAEMDGDDETDGEDDMDGEDGESDDEDVIVDDQDGNDTDEDADDNGAGFTLVAAAIAVMAIAGLARQRTP